MNNSWSLSSLAGALAIQAIVSLYASGGTADQT